MAHLPLTPRLTEQDCFPDTCERALAGITLAIKPVLTTHWLELVTWLTHHGSARKHNTTSGPRGAYTSVCKKTTLMITTVLPNFNWKNLVAAERSNWFKSVHSTGHDIADVIVAQFTVVIISSSQAELEIMLTSLVPYLESICNLVPLRYMVDLSLLLYPYKNSQILFQTWLFWLSPWIAETDLASEAWCRDVLTTSIWEQSLRIWVNRNPYFPSLFPPSLPPSFLFLSTSLLSFLPQLCNQFNHYGTATT